DLDAAGRRGGQAARDRRVAHGRARDRAAGERARAQSRRTPWTDARVRALARTVPRLARLLELELEVLAHRRPLAVDDGEHDGVALDAVGRHRVIAQHAVLLGA